MCAFRARLKRNSGEREKLVEVERHTFIHRVS